jgi:NAD(P)H dehydrogenase (quinone)
MILITGAAGKTGKAIVSSLLRRNAQVRAFVRTTRQGDEMRALGVRDILIGDLRNPSDLAKAVAGVAILYYICPNITPDEPIIGQALMAEARSAGVNRFVYHSVLHPQIEAMPHHWQKMRTEELLFTSGMDFTILQPCAYMQNILTGWQSIVEQGKYIIPYSTNARLSIVDLQDVADAVANILTQNTHANAIYELAGPDPMSQADMAVQLSEVLARPVKAESIDRAIWVKNTLSNGMETRQVDILCKMFEYYENYGLVGNSSTLCTLLGRKPTSFKEFLVRQISLGGNR